MSASTASVPVPAQAVAVPQTGQHLILHGISWETYEQLLADYENSHAAHFTYDQGGLEIMVLSFEHEKINRLFHSLFEVVAEEMDIDFENAGSTTLKREDRHRGFEPDTCFYVNHVEHIRNKTHIDLSEDPAPDVVIEIDLSSRSLDKLPIYAAVGVTEVWRYYEKGVEIFILDNGAYQHQEESKVLPGLTNQIISGFITHGSLKIEDGF
jgi:Uma2 family endonuclease